MQAVIMLKQRAVEVKELSASLVQKTGTKPRAKRIIFLTGVEVGSQSSVANFWQMISAKSTEKFGRW
jgi:hypothetical protein